MAFGSVNVPGGPLLGAELDTAELRARVSSIEKALGGEKIPGSENPTAQTPGTVGQVYLNTETGEEFECVAVTEAGSVWEPRKVAPVKIFEASSTPPERTDLLWIDTTPDTGGLKYHNGSAWVPVPVLYT